MKTTESSKSKSKSKSASATVTPPPAPAPRWRVAHDLPNTGAQRAASLRAAALISLADAAAKRAADALADAAAYVGDVDAARVTLARVHNPPALTDWAGAGFRAIEGRALPSPASVVKGERAASASAIARASK